MKKHGLNLWSIAPLVRIFIPLTIGVILSSFVFPNHRLAFLISILSLLSLAAIHFKPWTRKFSNRVKVGLVIQSITLLMGILLGIVHSYSPSNHLTKVDLASDLFLVEVYSSPVSKAKSTRFEARACAQLSKGQISDLEGGLIVSGTPSLFKELNVGDQIWINARLKPISGRVNPHEFNYQSFMANRGITHQVYIKNDLEYIFASKSTRWSDIFTTTRDFLQQELDHLPLNKDTGSVLSALLLGQKQSLDPELGKSFAAAGAMHVLAVSGLHVGLIYLILFRVLFFFDKLKNGTLIKASILILFLWLYAGITGFSPSVLRATTMFTAIAFAQASARRTNIYNTLAFSVIVLIIVNPKIIYEVGFQLSYLAVAGIVFLQPRVYGWINSKNWLMDKVWQISSVSIAAQLATFPLSLYYFHMFPSYFLISNLIVIPLAGVILSLGLGYFSMYWIPLVQKFLGHILSWSVELLSNLVSWVSNLTGAQVVVGDFQIIPMLMLYGLIIAFVGYCIQRKGFWMKLTLVWGIGIIANSIVKSEIRSTQRHMTMYEIRGKDVIGIKRGDECWLLSESIITEQDLTYKIKPDLQASGVVEFHQIATLGEFQVVRNDMLLTPEIIKLRNLEIKGPDSSKLLAQVIDKLELSSWD